MDVLIVDDEPLARERLQRLLQDQEDYRVVGAAADAEQALQLVQSQDPHVVLLDIQMPGASGLNLAQQLNDLDDPPVIIFCTAYAEHALDAFEVNASDYLLKPVRRDKLQAALLKAQTLNRLQVNQLQSQQPDHQPRQHTEQPAFEPDTSTRHYISARSRKGVERIALDEVFYFLADQKYVTVFHQHGETLIDEALKELQQQLVERFVRIHRNALVAVSRIQAIEKNAQGQYCVRLQGTEDRPQVSRRHLAALRERLSQQC